MSLEQMRRNLVGTASAAETSGGPSLKETLDWLKEKIPLGIVHYVDASQGLALAITDQNTVWSFDSCTVVLGSVATMMDESHPDPVPGVITTRYTLPLGVLTGGVVQRTVNHLALPSKFVSGERWGYWLYLNGAEEISFTKSLSGSQTLSDSYTTDSLCLIFNDESLAQRVLQAFNHAAALCRKQEPF
jgi:hypothetical protein